MLKLLLVVLVVVLALAWVMGRGRSRRQPPPAQPKPKAGADPVPAQMLACSHCGVHLPRADAAFDAAGRPYCSAEHRVAGPR